MGNNGARNTGEPYRELSLRRSDSMVFAYDHSVSAIAIGVPVLRGCDFLEPVDLADVFETLVYELPGALPV